MGRSRMALMLVQATKTIRVLAGPVTSDGGVGTQFLMA